MGAALGTMVANLSSHKRGWDDRWEEFSDWAEKGKEYYNELLDLVDEDTCAFNQVMDAFSLPNGTAAEKAAREAAVEKATKVAIEVPLRVMTKATDSMEVIKAMAKIGNPNSASDAGVGALCVRSAVRGAFLNVKINASDLKDQRFAKEMVEKGQRIDQRSLDLESEILAIVEGKL